MKILIVEDESAIAEVEKAYLEHDGYKVMVAPDGLTALELFNSDENFDLILLDLMLPGMSGIDVCKGIRKTSTVPIIMLTAKSGENDVVKGLDAGADDYIVKPFSPKILMARIRANLRKHDEQALESTRIISLGETLIVEVDNFTVKKNGEKISLTRNEFLIFSKMAERPQKIWSRDELINYALGYEYVGFERSIDSYIKNIRKKLSDSNQVDGYIQTVHGFGYRISENVS